MTLWLKKLNFGWPLLLGLVGSTLASLEVLESPNSLDGEAFSEEPVTFNATLSTEQFVEDPLTTISGNPTNFTEPFPDQTEIVGNETATTDGSANATVVESQTNRDNQEMSPDMPRLDTLWTAENNTKLLSQNYSSTISVANSTLSLFNETGLPEKLPKSLDPEDFGQIGNLSSNATLVPEARSYASNINSNDSAIPDGLQSALPTVRNLKSTEFVMIDPVTDRWNDPRLRVAPNRFNSLWDSTVTANGTSTTVDTHSSELGTFNNSGSTESSMLNPVTDQLNVPRLRIAPYRFNSRDSTELANVTSTTVDTHSSEFGTSTNSTIRPENRLSKVQPRQVLLFANIPKVTVPTTSTPKTTTKKKTSFRSNALSKKPKAKITRKSNVRKMVKITSKATQSKPKAGFRSARKAKTVVKRRFRQVVRRRRATTTRLVFRRRRRTTRLVRKTTTLAALTVD